MHRVPRLWSNEELSRFAHLFHGSVVNVSAWRDEDKQGSHYRSYFSHASEYVITNFDAAKRGYQGLEGELFLDLEQPLPASLRDRFDVAFNHTTLEHVYDFRTAFSNICALSKDIVIIVVPFVQQMHTYYGDFWRFSPQALARMFSEEGLEVGYLSFNNNFRTSVYIFCIATKKREKWSNCFPFEYSIVDSRLDFLREPFVGCNAIHSNWVSAFKARTASLWNRKASRPK